MVLSYFADDEGMTAPQLLRPRRDGIAVVWVHGSPRDDCAGLFDRTVSHERFARLLRWEFAMLAEAGQPAVRGIVLVSCYGGAQLGEPDRDPLGAQVARATGLKVVTARGKISVNRAKRRVRVLDVADLGPEFRSSPWIRYHPDGARRPIPATEVLALFRWEDDETTVFAD